MGKQIDRYQLQSQLGQGGMATVYYAYDPRFKRRVAVKVLPREFLHDENFISRFEREAMTIAGLEHLAIVPVYDFGEYEGQPYLVMRYMPGGSLLDRIKRGPVSLAELHRIIDQLAPALDKAHDHGVIHRDLKPGNILFDEDDNAYLSDFGIAKIREATTQLTGSGFVGTPAYMAPEFADTKDLTAAVDIYALGVILYQMLTGKPPFQAATPLGTLLAHVNQPVPDVQAARPDLPAAMQRILERAMAKKPADRYHRAVDLAADLKRVVTAHGIGDSMLPTPLDETRPSEVGHFTSSHALPVEPPPPPLAAPVPSEVLTMDGYDPAASTPVPGKPKRRRPIILLVAIGVGLVVLIVLLGISGLALSGMLDGTEPPQAPTRTPGSTASATDLPVTPSINITQPLSDSELEGMLIVIGTAWMPDFSYYQVEIGTGSAPTDWTTIQGQTSQEVVDGPLAQVDLHDVVNGPNTIRLLVFNTSGESSEARVSFYVVNSAVTATVTLTATNTPTVTPQPTTAQFSPPTKTPTPTITPSPTNTGTPTNTPTSTPSITPSPTDTPTITLDSKYDQLELD